LIFCILDNSQNWPSSAYWLSLAAESHKHKSLRHEYLRNPDAYIAKQSTSGAIMLRLLGCAFIVRDDHYERWRQHHEGCGATRPGSEQSCAAALVAYAVANPQPVPYALLGYFQAETAI
jgi:hypothetical protein